MATSIEGLSLNITTTAGQASAAMKELSKQLAVMGAVLGSLNFNKLVGALNEVEAAFRAVERAAKRTSTSSKDTKKASDDVAQGIDHMSTEAKKASGSQVELGGAVQKAADEVEDASDKVQQSARKASGEIVKAGELTNEELDGIAKRVKQAAEADMVPSPKVMQTALKEAQASASGMNQFFSALGGNSGFVGDMFNRISSAAQGLAKGLGFSQAETLQLTQALGSMGMVTGIVTTAINAVKQNIERFIKFLQFGVKVIKSAVSAYKKFLKLLSDVTGFSKLKQEISSILSMLKRQLIRRLINNYIKAIEDAFDTGITNLEAYDERFGSAMQSYRNAMGLFRNSVTVAIAPLITYLIPYIVQFINNLTWACNQIARLTALLTGQKTYTIARSFESIENAASSAGSAAKEAAKTILGFDEINQLNGNKGSGGGGGAGSGDGISAYETVDVGDWPYRSWGEAFSAFLDWLNGKLPSLNQALSKAADWFNNFNLNLYEMFTFDGVKEKIAELGSNIGSALNEFLNDKLDWKLWGSAIGAALGAALNFAYNFLMQFEWVKFGANLADFLMNAIREIDPVQLGTVLAHQFTILFDIVTGFLSNREAMGKIGTWAGQVVASFVGFIADKIMTADLDAVREGIMTFVENALKALNKKGTYQKIALAIDKLGKFVGNLLSDLAKSPAVRQLISQVVSIVIKVAWEAIRAGLQGIGDLITDSLGAWARQLPSAFAAMFQSLTNGSWILGNLGGIVTGVENSLARIENATESTTSAVNKTFNSVGTSARTAESNLRTSSSNVSAHMKTMADQCSTYSANAKNAITNNLTAAKTNATKAASDLQVGVSNNLKGLSTAATNGVSGLQKNVTDGLNLAKNNAVKAATDAQKGVTNAFNSMYGGAKGGMNNLIYGAEKMANGIIDANNTIIKSFDSMHIGGKKVASSSGYVNKVSIPRLATGGIISNPTQAIIGERGAEAVLPLERNTGWIDRLASTIAESVSQTPVSQGGDTYVVLDGKVIAKAVNRINERDTRRYSPVG